VLDERGRPVDYRFLDINEAFERQTGLRREETVGRLVSEVLPGIDPFWVETYGRVALTGKPAFFERYSPKPLDRTYQVSAYRPAPGQFAAVFLDISERKRAEKALQESNEELEVAAEELHQQNEELLRAQLELQKSEELFRVVASSTPDHVLVQDKDLRYTLVVNPQMGLTQEDMIGKTDFDFLARDDAEKLTAIKRKVLETGKPAHVEMPLSSPEGTPEYFEGSYVPRLDAGGKPNGLIGYFRNVTERKRGEEELKRLSQFPGQNPNPVMRVTPDGRVLYANPPAGELLVALGGSAPGTVPPALWPLIEEASRQSRVVESDLVDGRGRTFWLAAVRPEGEAYINFYGRDITGRKQAERKVEYRSLLLSRVHDAVIGTDAGMRITYWNKGAENMFGFSEAEALGQKSLDLLRPTYGPGEREKILEELERRGVSESEIRLTHKDGREVVVEAHSTRLAEAEGTAGYVVVYRDNTDRVRAERALQESHEELEVGAEELRQQNEELLRVQLVLQQSEEEMRRLAEQRQVALDAARLGWWRYDPVTRMASWDERYKQIFGFESYERPNDEILAQIVHPEDRRELWAKVEAALDPAHPQPYAAEYRIIRPDGETRWIEAHGLASFAASGGERRAVSFVGTVADITERKRDEDLRQALAEQERLQLGAAVEQASEAVVMIDLDGQIRYVNAAFESINRIPRREAVGRPYFEFLAGDPAAGLVVESVRTGRAWHGPLVRRIGEGRSVELEVAISTVKNPKGKVVGGLVTEKDVTQENALQRALRQGQKMEALGTLAGGITHDFNNILGAIIMNTELALLDLDLSHPARAVLPNVLQAASRGKDLVKQIITFSRQREWNRTLIEVAPVVREAVRFLRSTLPKDVAIRDTIAPDSGAVLGDASQLNQVVVNLGQNAAQAMREGGGRLDIMLEPVEVEAADVTRNPDLTAGPHVRLTVADTGCGMPPEVLERIFEPFFTTRGPGGGSGLGLAVVHGIVRSGGGAITVASVPGQGSVFQVYLPRREGGTSETKEAEQPRPAGGRERILLVEDEAGQRTSLARSLERLGYTVTARAAGRTALAAFRKDPAAFDLVVTDQTMPKMTGLEMAAAMVKARPGLPVILCTGFSDKIDGTRLARGPIREFLMKPFTLEEITRLIRAVLEKGSSGTTPDRSR
jgi:PAS domain S-box-containing protein